MIKIESLNLIIMVIAGVAGCGAGFFICKLSLQKQADKLKEDEKKVIDTAKREAEALKKEAILESKDEIYKMKFECERELSIKRSEFISIEKRLAEKEDKLDRRQSVQDKRDSELAKKENETQSKQSVLQKKINDYDSKLDEQKRMLEKIACISQEEAKNILIKTMEDEAKTDVAKMVMKMEEEAKRTAETRSNNLVVNAIQKYASDYIAEATVSYVNLPNEVIKGRIIGREGRNIRALENATGIDLIIDDTPEAVILSGFDPVRREIARLALEKLIEDGRIHPSRIEEIVAKVKIEVEKGMYSEAEKILFDLGIHDMHNELVKLLGMLKFRYSYGQNNLMHANEVASLAKVMATELNLNVRLTVRAAILHDIGKALNHTIEGTHAQIGMDYARKYGETELVVNAIGSHHNEVEPTSPEAVLIAAADALSASRPGARRESFEAYIKRLEKLEEIASGFSGIEKAYAIQAGREIRIIVKETELNDAEASRISREIAKKIENELTYPGQIKVTVIREQRFIEYAK